MARSIQDYDGTKEPIDSDYPEGDIADKTISTSGTKINRTSNADIHQFFVRLRELASILANGLPDNAYNGYQNIEAATKIFRRFGEYVSWDRATSLSVSGLTSPCIEVQAAAPNTGDISLEDSASALVDAGTVVVLNKSANPVDLNAGGSDTINGGASYALAAGARIEIVQTIAGAKWEIVSLT